MVKIRNLTESLENKYNIDEGSATLDESLTEDWVDDLEFYSTKLSDYMNKSEENYKEVCDIIDSGTNTPGAGLGDLDVDELKYLYDYIFNDEQLIESSASIDELPFDEIMNKESTEGNMDWYEEDHPTWKRYKYKKEVDEAYEHEIEDELDYIMDDDSLSDDEKEQAISDLYSKYNYNESLNEDISEDKIQKALQVLIDNGIDEDEAEIVLQAIGYTLLDKELFPEE